MKTYSMHPTNKLKEFSLWAGITVITIVAFFLTYYYSFSSPIKIIIWIVWFFLCGVFFFFTSKGQQVLVFGNEAKLELQKVVWPTRQETIQTTSIVMIMVAVTGFILWGTDFGMMMLIAKITHLG
jgi:preprotein translocase subunit SecE